MPKPSVLIGDFQRGVDAERQRIIDLLEHRLDELDHDYIYASQIRCEDLHKLIALIKGETSEAKA